MISIWYVLRVFIESQEVESKIIERTEKRRQEENELVKKQKFMFCHILRCDWWFTSYEWNANNSVRTHSNTTHWQAHRVCFMLSVLASTCVCMREFLFLFICCMFIRSFNRRIVCSFSGVAYANRDEHDVRVKKDQQHTIWSIAFAFCTNVSSLFFLQWYLRVYWMRS